MSNSGIYLKTSDLLAELKQVLQHHQLWADCPPQPEALASTAPFCCDTMDFETWLQFVFIPKMRLLIDAKTPLPSKIALLPMGEHSWANKPDNQALLTILQDIDELLGKQ